MRASFSKVHCGRRDVNYSPPSIKSSAGCYSTFSVLTRCKSSSLAGSYLPIILLIEEILHHLGCKKNYKLLINWCRISFINSMIPLISAPCFCNFRHQQQFHEGLVVFLLDQAQSITDLRAHEAVHGLGNSALRPAAGELCRANGKTKSSCLSHHSAI